MLFLSTPSARRATHDVGAVGCIIVNFYPRPPRGGRLYEVLLELDDLLISIHALREEGDLGIGGQLSEEEQFLSTPSARRATCRDQYDELQRLFLSTPSARRAT